MKNFNPKLDKKTGRFLPTPPGEKPPKMKEMEKKLNVEFKKDYEDFYLSYKMGQKLFARRWGASNKNQIFSRNPKSKRRAWVQMLNLPSRDSDKKMEVEVEKNKFYCEICRGNECSLDKAHWIENSKGGSTKASNILNLCPNCHRKLDRNNIEIIEKARAILLIREIRKLLESKNDEETLRKQLVDLCRQILNARNKSS